MRAGLIVNPASGKASGKGLRLAELLSKDPTVRVHVLLDVAQLPDILRSLAAEGVLSLFISSGDGTIQAIQTVLAEQKPFAALPRLGLLPHGTTNMTAATLGIRGKSPEETVDLMRRRSFDRLVIRPTLRIVNPADRRPRHGMFLGTGLLWRIAKFSQDSVQSRGLKGEFSSLITLLAAILRRPFGGRSAFEQPHTMMVTMGERVLAQGEKVLFLATTLERLVLGTRPFWGTPACSLRATAIPFPTPGLFRWLLPVMYGTETRRPPPGSVSFSLPHFSIDIDCPFVLDGEFFEPPRDQPLHVELGPDFEYILG